MAKTLIFDMDGVIVDSEYIFLSTKTQMLLDRGIATDESYQYQFMGTTFDYMWQVMKAEHGLSETVSELIEEMNARRQTMIDRDGVRAIKGVIDLIRHLKQEGWQLGLASSSPRQDILHHLEALHLRADFDQIVSGEEVAQSKPAPDIFLRTAELLGCSPQDCIVIEDTKNGSLAAKGAGMTCIGFANPDYPSQDLRACDKVVSDFAQLYTYFQ